MGINNIGRQMETITKKIIISEISRKHGIHPSQVQLILQSFFDYMVECLSKGERCEFRDFGIFETVVRKQKIGRNPKKADVPIIIPEKRVVKFSPGKTMKSKVR